MAICKNCGKPLILSGGKCIYCRNIPNRKVLSKGGRTVSGSEFPPVRTFTINGVSFKMILIEGGTFLMGCKNNECNFHNAKPVHTEIIKSFYIGESEVTQSLWEMVMGNNPSYFKGNNLPVETVSWNDSISFIDKLNNLTKQLFRLPTEAEWEFAAYGGNHSAGYKYAGSDNLDDVAWHYGNSGDSHLQDYFNSEKDIWYSIGLDNKCQTHSVKTKMPNELGLFDMSGNVYEWCNDIYRPSYDLDAVQSYRVVRGGYWLGNESMCRPWNRMGWSQQLRDYLFGFRLAMTPRYDSARQ